MRDPGREKPDDPPGEATSTWAENPEPHRPPGHQWLGGQAELVTTEIQKQLSACTV